MQHSLTKSALALLVSIAAATRSEDGFLYVMPKQSQSLVDAGYVQLNDQMSEGDKLATRATEQGLALVDSINGEQGADNGQEGSDGAAGSNAAPASAKQTRIAPAQATIATVAIPVPDAPKGGRKGSAYPFDDLTVNGSFFVAASEDRPNPAKSLASTVTSANERYAEVVEGEFRTNRNGDQVPVTKQVREFIVRPVQDGAPWGEQFAGVAGAGVWRTL